MTERILLVDDEPNLLVGLRRALGRIYDISTAEGGAQGLTVLKNTGPFAVVVSDYRMPGLDGIQFLSNARALAPDTVRVLFTGHADLDSAMGAINEGSVFRLLLKPCKPEQLLSTLQASLEQHRLITAEKTLLDKTLRGSVRVLADILGAVNPVAFSRSSRTKDRCCRMATSLGLRDLWQVEVAALLSQIGCATIPPKILERKLMGEALSEAEEKLYREHPKAGARLLQEIPRLEPVAQAIAQQMASQPPPSKLAGILQAVLDHDQLVRSGRSPNEAIELMLTRIGVYDPLILHALAADVLASRRAATRELVVAELKPGMVLAKDLCDRNGVILIASGHPLTEVIVLRLAAFVQMGTITEPVSVVDPVAQEEHPAA